MLEACALALLPVLCPPPEPGMLDLYAEARRPFAHLASVSAPGDDERAPSEDLSEPARDDGLPVPTTSERDAKPEVIEPWASLADCESGNWVDGGAAFEPGSARWDWARPGTEIPPWGDATFHGGLQFHPDTWDWLAPVALDGPPARAYDATPAEQVAVAEEVFARQGWGAWPVCSRKIGLR